jgi:hypothetical protein
MVGIARRSVLRGGIAVALLPLAGASVAAPAAATVGVGAVTRAGLEAAVGDPVRIVGVDGVTAGVLDGVVDVLGARSGHPEAFVARIRLDRDATLPAGLVDLELPGQRVLGVGLLAAGGPDDPIAVLLVDRRPVSEHLALRTH